MNDPYLLEGTGSGGKTWEAVHKEINTLPERPTGDPADDIENPLESWTTGQEAPPQSKVEANVKTFPIDIGGNVKFPKDLLAALKNLFTKTEDFLNPFIATFASEAGKDLLAIGNQRQ